MSNNSINWSELVDQYKDDFVKDLIENLRIDSVRNDEEATDEFPVGPGPAKALEAFLDLGKRDGFETKQLANWAGHIEFGEGPDTEENIIGVLGHVDVVPVGTGWDTDPFEPVVKNGNIYARGASDDKGPTMAAYYAIKLLKDLNLDISKKVRLIIGTDEESGWQGLKYYFENEVKPDAGFSPDANFPIINGEKGILTIQIKQTANQTGETQLISFDSGLRANMVPQNASARVESTRVAEFEEKFKIFLDNNPVTGDSRIEDNQIIFNVIGKPSHGAQPQNGINAATYLATFLKELDLADDAKQFVDIAGDYLHDDTEGHKLGIAHEDEVMGKLSMNAAIFNFNNDEGAQITLNMRFPKGTDDEKIVNTIAKTLDNYDIEISKSENKAPHYVSGDDPLVKTLLDIYSRQTGLEGHEKVIGGGTYGRLLNRGVAYGSMFPDSPDTMHQANEFSRLDDLYRSIAIYAEAIYELIK